MQLLDMQPMTLLLLGVAICWAQDIVCKKGKLSKRISVGEVDSFTFKTQAGRTYDPNTNCHVTYNKDESCPEMRFYCSVFKINNRHKNCKGKDKMQIKTPQTKKGYCRGKGPDVTTSARYLRVSFISDKRKQSSGATCRVECGETRDAAMFREFQTKYNKTSSNQKEKVKRFKIWQQRTILMKEHNKLFQEGKKTYRKGENAMFDMTPEEIEANYMGLSLHPNSYSSKVSRISVDISDLQASINWTEKGRVTSVKNQAGCGSCWAHSAAGALEGAYKADTNRLVSMDVSYLIDCSTTDGCKGANPGLAFNHVMLNGITIDNDNETYRGINSFHKKQDIHEALGIIFNNSLQADQYSMRRKSQCVLENNNPVIIRGIWRVNKGREDELMQAVAEIGPVSVLICAPMDLIDYAGEGDDVFYEENCSEACNTPSHVNHAALAVGYGKQINKITNENESYWLVKNSWGTDWGNKGYIKMARNRDNNCGIASIATYPTVWGDLICGEDLDDLLAAGGNSELEIQCCDDSKMITCAGAECKTVCGGNEPIECLSPVEEFENIDNCNNLNRKIAQVKITLSYCKYRAPCPRLDGSSRYCSCCKYSFYYRGYKGCAPRCNHKYCKREISDPVNHNETGSDLICQDEKEVYFLNLTESNTSLTVLCSDQGRTRLRTCTGSDCSTVCGEDSTCIKLVESMEYLGHTYDDVVVVTRTEDSCKFAPCPTIGNSARFCKCCEFPSYKVICPDMCVSSYCSSVHVDGGWSDWEDWGSCNPKTGTKERVRRCDNPSPDHGGGQCVGDVEETQFCSGILITGGWSRVTEVFLPHTGKSCSLSDLPDERLYHTLDLVGDRHLLCGGNVWPETQDTCLHFRLTSPSGSWDRYGKTLRRRFKHSSWVTPDGLYLLGSAYAGILDTGSGTSTELACQHNKFVLEDRTSSACSISDESSTIITGGMYTNSLFNASIVVVRYNLQGLVEYLPSLSQGRYGHGCGAFNKGSTKIFVIAGGEISFGNKLSSTETWTTGAKSWTPGQPLPRTLTYPAFVTLGSTFFLMGGFDGRARLTEVLAYNGTWTEVGHMNHGREKFAAAMMLTDTSPLNLSGCS